MRNEGSQQQHRNKQGSAENRDSETDTRGNRKGIELGLFKHGALLSLCRRERGRSLSHRRLRETPPAGDAGTMILP